MNKIIANYHTHTTVCDGKNTPEETVLAALDGGFSALGFSSHGYTPFDLKYCMHDTEAYISEISRLKEKHKGKIVIIKNQKQLDKFYKENGLTKENIS